MNHDIEIAKQVKEVDRSLGCMGLMLLFSLACIVYYLAEMVEVLEDIRERLPLP